VAQPSNEWGEKKEGREGSMGTERERKAQTSGNREKGGWKARVTEEQTSGKERKREMNEGPTDEAHDLLDELLLVEQALALGVVLVAKVVGRLGRGLPGSLVLLVLLLGVGGALLSVLRANH
jgi:hypothetical protein